MVDLTKEEVRTLGHVVGLEIQDPELTEVTYSLNALLEDLDGINPRGWTTLNPYPLSCPQVSHLANAILCMDLRKEA